MIIGYRYIKFVAKKITIIIEDKRYKNKKYIHALLYANCINILLPVLKELNKREDYYVTVTAVRPGDIGKVRSEKIKVSNNNQLSNNFFLSRNKKRLFLNAADFKHIYNKLGHESVYKARRLGIPSLNVQHGLISFFNLADPQFHMTSDKIAVWGKFVYKQLLELQHRNPEDIFITGNPAFDSLANRSDSGNNISDILSFLGLHKNDNFLVFFSCTQDMASKGLKGISLDRIKLYLTSLYSSIKKNLPELKLVIKPHPAEHQFLHLLEETIKKAKIDAILINDSNFRKSFDLYDLISASKFVICYPSTTCLESILLRKLVVMVKVPGEKTFLDVDADNKNFFIIDSTWENLTDNLNNFFKSNKALLLNRGLNLDEIRSLLSKHIYELDGKATQRVIQTIETIIGNGKNDRRKRVHVI
jgi:hypothetical protein